MMNWKKKIVFKLARLLNVELSPIEQIYELEDNPTKAYVWKLSNTASHNVLANIIKELHERFINNNGREPHSLHIAINDIEDIKTLDGAVLEDIILPWIETSKKSLKKGKN